MRRKLGEALESRDKEAEERKNLEKKLEEYLDDQDRAINIRDKKDGD